MLLFLCFLNFEIYLEYESKLATSASNYTCYNLYN